ncbi:MAG: LacI family DNA-binding transcriptional regulator [Clostridia bacterium]|nr:LacI family DNA-binding transcriptional regulator [Clostridia bacterium]MBR1686479.1 LacI family DNA-binding transcriptional regulator [Clostridia bacterium]MBR2287529.1 LacI family DNA-binding transcriptional regulator [Clostridia bacterium]
MVTIKDIARECGVSAATVSRALNGIDTISSARALSIRETAREMGYAPNAVARALKTNRSWMIGVAFEEHMNHSYFSGLIEAIREKAESEGYDLVFLSRTKEGAGLDYPDRAVSRKMDGVIIIHADFAEEGIQKLLSGSIPVVCIDDDTLACHALMSDYRLGTAQLVQAAYDKGHRHIALIHGQIGNSTNARIRGFREQMDKLGLHFGESDISEAAFRDGKAVAAQILRLLETPDKPTCFLLPDDASAIDALQILARKGLHAPRDFSCMGYDGIPLAEKVYPTLATYRQNVQRMAQEIVDIIQRSVGEGEKHAREVQWIEGEVLLGETLGNV